MKISDLRSTVSLALLCLALTAFACESFSGIGLRVAIEPTEPTDDDPLSVVVVTSPAADGDEVWTYTYAWSRNDGLQDDLTSDTVPADRTEPGDTWSVDVTPVDEDGNVGEMATASVSLPDPLVDNDGDGFTVEDDCDDGNPNINPAAIEICNGLDDDCNEVVDDGTTGDFRDDDMDGFDNCSDDGVPGGDGTDCNDGNPDVNPGAVETCNGNPDDDCDGVDDPDETDDDNDLVTECGGDCDDGDPALNPLDEDMDGASTCDAIPDCDDTTGALNVDDVDMDGSTTCDGDCDDIVPEANVEDLDNDGVTTCGPDGIYGTEDDDCDDDDGHNFPGNPEVCDDADNDCDNAIEAGTVDHDNDMFTICDGDCDDHNPAANPDATEICNAVDDDCVGGVDDGFDVDGDGVTTCGPDGTAGNADDDCDDTLATGTAVNPTVTEICNAVDDNCSGAVDDGFDVDNDGVTTCGPDGTPGNADDDCDDTLATGALVNPGATEICNAVDDDCSGVVDDGFDVDGDSVTTCGPDGVLGNADDDCDDSLPSIFPGAVEVIDGLDQDCDGTADEYTWTQVQTLVTMTSCGCHGGATHSSGLTQLSGPNGWGNVVNTASTQASALDRVTPFDSTNSYLYQKITNAQANGTAAMPYGSAGLSNPDHVTGIKNWIDAGAADD